MATGIECSVDSCTKRVKGRGWCSAHYRRWQLYGDVQADIPIKDQNSEPSHGSVSGYVYWGCRCEECFEAKTTYEKERSIKNQLQGKTVGGKPSKDRYLQARVVTKLQNLGYEINPDLIAPEKPPHKPTLRERLGIQERLTPTEYQRLWRADNRTRPVPEGHVHGAVSTYRNWGCRCPLCVEANTEDARIYKAKKKRVQ